MNPPELRPGQVAAVVFDLDGTLVDSFDAITEGVNHARARFGLPPLGAEAVRAKVGLGAGHLLAETVGSERAAEGLRAFTSRYEEVYLDGTASLPRVSETLSTLRARGLRLAVASNKPARFTEGLVRHFGWDRFVEAVESPESAGAAKPDPSMIRRALGSLGVARDRGLYVGDMPLDVESGARAGVAVVLVATGPAAPETLRATGARVVGELSDLVDVLFPADLAAGS